MLDVRRLAPLAAVLDAGSMTAAAEQLGYSPSAVSQQLRRLEAEAGQPLVQRLARGVLPTEAGAVLAGHARHVLRRLEAAEAAEADLAELAGLRRGTLAIGTFPTIASALMPQVVSRFRRQYPDIRLDVRSARYDELIAMLESGRVGISLLWDYAWQRVDAAQFSLTPLLDDPTVLVVSEDHRLARRRTTSMTELADEDWVVRAHDHPVAEVLERSCRAAGFSPRIAFEANDYQEAQAMVSVGLGVALAPRTAVTTPRPDVRVLGLGREAPSRRVLLAHRPDRLRAPAELAMHQMLVDVAREYQTRA
ncbi:putative LysR-family transcriptional regulator [Pseudonocardia sp. Ae717_Ps2]|uniref:LysR family transcriptional regulator n=1 Tax=Pseudonocardia sp. Ae717_Ps2 TaxID=1885573 RepID=UPI00094B1014|nr:LysR substrate-binding domain-containing protein [Pseudonocardia sp. Ae717_Ps2]OLM30707.1 putative LysR-family transcriptional regulator [Pseudonocardia sp. Ae717_Ps2]